MELYLLKSATCLAIFFLFYKLVLENTTLHKLKRIYLLLSTIASFVIPFITFTQYVEITPIVQTFTEAPVTFTPMQATPNEPAPVHYTPFILWSIYTLGVLIFAIRFGRNLFSMIQKIRKNPSVKDKSIFYVLLHLPVTPHSFFNYIFFSRKDYEANAIPEEVMIHERAHVHQKHSWDLLFMELLRIVFWFNPLLYFVKNSIRLNHEFLADRAVLEAGADTSAYQNIILDFSSTSSVPAMAHSINYSSFKKRFTVMKTHTSKRAAWLKSLIVLPLLAVLIYGFSTTEVVEKTASNSNSEAHLSARSIAIQILDEKYIELDGVKIRKGKLASALTTMHTDITKTQRNRIMNFHVTSEAEITYSDLAFIQSVVSNYGYHRIVTPTEEIIRSKNNTPMLPETNGDGATPKQLATYNRLAKKHNAQPEETRTIGLDELKTLETLYRLMTSEQKENAQPFPKCSPQNKISSQQDYAKEYLTGALRNAKKAFVLQIELSEIRFNGIPVSLNSLASTLDAYTKDWEETDYTAAYPSILIAAAPPSFIEKVDVEFRKTHYSKANSGMSLIAINSEVAQKKATAAQISEYNKLANKYNSMSKYNMRIKGKDLTRLYYLYDLMTVEQRRKAEPFPSTPPPPPSPNAPKVKKGMKSDIPPPPPPPPAPEAPNVIDHIVDMAKKGASFQYGTKPISSDDAIRMAKTNENVSVATRTNGNGKTTVILQNKANSSTNSDGNIRYESVKSIKAMNVKETSGYIEINGETHFFHKKGDTIKYYDRFGIEVDENGKKASKMPKVNVKTSNVNLETGNIKINGEEHFYSRKNGVTSYFNKFGTPVDKKGRALSANDQKNPVFYYRGKKISSAKAHELLDKGSARITTSNNDQNGSYTVLLNDLDNPNSNNFKNVNFNDNQANNPNSVIDLTEVISKGAKFYLNDKKITTEKAKYLAEHTNDIARVNVIEKKNKVPVVYFWTK